MTKTSHTTYDAKPKVKHRWEVCTLNFRMFCNRCHKYPEYAGDDCVDPTDPQPPAGKEDL
jgi:hypothetical protein